ncbi:uncharacterized protein VP01_1645g7 [Puccinia sorghi]|uniref:Uncharacterized protein n=1 Tax=Puccinia sorghi TaxID=27349 RepID=A0A0L6VGR1_9BASI|nr:uncharacterized protein VP01_1645g7 [Puccinia sorghi]
MDPTNPCRHHRSGSLVDINVPKGTQTTSVNPVQSTQKNYSPCQWTLRILSQCKEIHINFKAQSEFYLNQGFLDEINRAAQRIHVEKLGPCDIDHWMSTPTTGHLTAEVYNRPVFYHGKSWSPSFFPSTTYLKINPPIFIE